MIARNSQLTLVLATVDFPPSPAGTHPLDISFSHWPSFQRSSLPRVFGGSTTAVSMSSALPSNEPLPNKSARCPIILTYLARCVRSGILTNVWTALPFLLSSARIWHMSARVERLLSDLDREIADTQDRLEKLRDARKSLASTIPTGRKLALPTALAQTTHPKQPDDAPQTPSLDVGAVDHLLATAMANGQGWGVAALAKLIKEKGHDTTKATINSALNRGAKHPNGLFEKVSHGVYRLREGGRSNGSPH
jgi:hypothetical protein